MEASPATLTGLLRRAAERFPSRRAISVAGKLDLTHSRLHRLVDFAANRLISAGIKPGDVVALTFPNTVEVRSENHTENDRKSTPLFFSLSF